MQVTETLSEGLKRGFTVVVPAADIESRRSARLADLSKTLRLPGFRPGKVPMPLVRQRYGTAVNAEVLEESVSTATQSLLEERKLRPASQPKIDLVTTDGGAASAADLEFKVELELLPDIRLPDFSQIALTRLKAEVMPEAVDQALANVAQANPDQVEIAADDLADRGGAQKDEILTVDFVGKLDGVPFPNGTAVDSNIRIGGSGFIPGFAEQLEGMKPGESRTISVTFPENYFSKDLVGKAATFDVTAKRLCRAVVRELTNEFATRLGFEDLADMRQGIRQRLQRDLDGLARLRLKRQLLDALVDLANFPAPQGMVDMEFDQIWQRLEAERKEGRLDEDDKDKDEATLRADYRAIADRRVRLGLLLAEIGRSNGITVGDDEMNRAMRVEASRYPGREDAMMEFFRKYPRSVDGLRGPLFEEKVIDFVVELAKVTDETVSSEALAEEPLMPPMASNANGGESPPPPETEEARASEVAASAPDAAPAPEAEHGIVPPETGG